MFLAKQEAFFFGGKKMADGTFRHKNGFTAVPNTVLEDKRLDGKALALYVMIQSKISIPDSSWKQSYFLNWFVSNEGNTENAFRMAWNKLKECGYLKVYISSYGKGTKREYELLDEPNEGECEVWIKSKSDEVVEEKLGKTTVAQPSENPTLEITEVRNSDSVKPRVEKKDSGINKIYKINNTKSKIKKRHNTQYDFEKLEKFILGN